MHTTTLDNKTLFSLAGIAVLAMCLGIALFGASMYAFHPVASKDCGCSKIHIPQYSQNDNRGSFESPISAHPVNTSALNELKEQQCVPCNQPRYPAVRQPSYPVVQPSYPVVQPSYPVVQPSYPQPTPAPALVQPVPAPTASTKAQIALFLDGSPKGEAMRQWFATDPALAKLRGNCTFEVYTPTSGLYLTRYASIVPVNQFPAILFQYAGGGHIHAAGKSTIPNTSGELYSDLRSAYEKAQSVKTAQVAPATGVVKGRAYNFDTDPTMGSNTQDCPGGQCDTGWRPGDKVRDLFDSVDPRNTVLWASPTEIVTYVLVGCIVLVGFAVLVVLIVRK